MLHDIQRAQNLSDDIVHSKNQQDSDKLLHKVMKRPDDIGAKLNIDKQKFSENKLTGFFDNFQQQRCISRSRKRQNNW